jgi:hypothetical protein
MSFPCDRHSGNNFQHWWQGKATADRSVSPGSASG